MSHLPCQVKLYISSLEALSFLASLLATALQPGDVVALNGPLGAGKTTLAQKLGEALGLQESVSSPTFVLMHEYRTGRFPIIHIDLYRLGEENANSLQDELFALLDEAHALLLVEWACYGSFLDNVLNVAIDIEPCPNEPNARILTISSVRPLLAAKDIAGMTA